MIIAHGTGSSNLSKFATQIKGVRTVSLRAVCAGRQAKLIVTSPPYYGLRTYVSDQWLRNWFLGGADRVDYSLGLAYMPGDRFFWNYCRVLSKSAPIVDGDPKGRSPWISEQFLFPSNSMIS